MKLIVEIDKRIYEHAKLREIEGSGSVYSQIIANGTPEDDFSEIVKRPINVKWSYSPYTTDLTCPICREVSKKSIFNNFCPSCGAGMIEESKNEPD